VNIAAVEFLAVDGLDRVLAGEGGKPVDGYRL